MKARGIERSGYKSVFLLMMQFLFFLSAGANKDSLIHVIRTHENNITKADACIALIEDIAPEDPDSAMAICESTLLLCGEIGYRKGLSSCYGWMSYLQKQNGRMVESIEWLQKGIRILETDTNRSDLASAYSNLGSIYYDLKNLEEAAHYFHESEKIRKELDDKEGLSNSYYNLGNIYSQMDDYEKAIGYYDKALAILEKIEFIPGIAYVNLGKGAVYFLEADYERSLSSHNEALKLFTMMGDKRGEAMCLKNNGKNFLAMGKLDQARSSGERSLIIAEEIGQVSIIRDASLLLKEVYLKKQDFRNAYFMLEKYHLMRDSINNEEIQKAAIRTGFQLEYEKKAVADSISFAREKEIENIRHESQLNSERSQRYILYGGIGFLVVTGALIFRGYRRKKMDNSIILEQKARVEEQKEMIEEKQQEILDSISYAKRIQAAILPPEQLFKNYFPDSFIVYMPKDIVAGDFYWLDIVKDENSDPVKIMFAAADCTGHGVPGAMVSVLCNGALNRSVHEYGLTDPGGILDKAREIVIQEFERSSEDVKDGMDISLCVLDVTNNILQWSGANNPLWIIRDSEITEYKADKQPIGKYPDMQPFTTHSIEMKKGDQLIVFTDGFADQFGGPRKKKLKYASFQKMLLSVNDQSLEKQSVILTNEFEQWKGELEQIDDVCVISVKI